MAGRRSTKLGAIFSAAFALAGLLGNASPSMAQSEGISGFDWIGTDPANINQQRCYASNNFDDGAYNRTFTAWTPPASGTPKTLWTYSMQNFRAQVGSISFTPEPPANYAGWHVYVYDSLDAARTNPLNAFRARFTFEKESPGISYQNSYDCHFWTPTGTVGIPCFRLTLNLTQPTSVQYKTAGGQITQTPLKLVGGTRYFFSLAGFESSPTFDIPCVVRTTPGLAQTYSPPPSPGLTVALNPAQQAESGLPGTTPFPLAHSDFQTIIPGLCDSDRTPVNYLVGFSTLAPYLEYTGDGEDPRTCGAPDEMACCLRTQSAHYAKALGVNRIITKLHQMLSYKAVSAVAIRADECPGPQC